MSSYAVADSPLTRETLERYAGRWVAIRGSEVVADASELRELVANSDVRATDVLYRVPAEGTYYY